MQNLKDLERCHVTNKMMLLFSTFVLIDNIKIFWSHSWAVTTKVDFPRGVPYSSTFCPVTYVGIFC